MCIDPHQIGFIGKGSDRLQLIKFWLSGPPGKRVCGGAKIFGSALLQPARSVCVSSERFFILYVRPTFSVVTLIFGLIFYTIFFRDVSDNFTQ